MTEARTILITGGGTGGHVYPGLALAGELEHAADDVRIVWVGTADRVEARAVPAAGYPIEFLEVRFLKGRRGLDFARSLATLPAAGIRALRTVRRHRPAAVIGVGGYVSGPVCAAAVALRTPMFLLEQNAAPGVTNRLLARWATAVYATFEDTADRFEREDVRVYGNPIRRDVLAAERATDRGSELRLLVLGGSQGARPLNDHVPAIAAAIARGGVSLQVRHSCGAAALDRTAARYQEFGIDATVEPFIDDMARAYAEADFVISRSGATTISELTAIGVPALFVPFAAAADDHQTANARSVVEADGAVMVTEEALADIEEVAGMLSSLLTEPSALARMGAAARELGRPDAGARIAADILEQVS